MFYIISVWCFPFWYTCFIDHLFFIGASNIPSLNPESSLRSSSVPVVYWNAHITQNIITITAKVCYIDIIESEIEEENGVQEKLGYDHLP